MAINDIANKYFHDVLMNVLNNKAFTDLSWIVLETQNKVQYKTKKKKKNYKINKIKLLI